MTEQNYVAIKGDRAEASLGRKKMIRVSLGDTVLKVAYWFNKTAWNPWIYKHVLGFITFACYHLVNIYCDDEGEGAGIW